MTRRSRWRTARHRRRRWAGLQRVRSQAKREPFGRNGDHQRANVADGFMISPIARGIRMPCHYSIRDIAAHFRRHLVRTSTILGIGED